MANMGFVAREGDPVFCDSDYHAGAAPLPVTGTLKKGTATAVADDKRVVLADGKTLHDHTACQIPKDNFVVITGSQTLIIDDCPAAIAGSKTFHCGSNPALAMAENPTFMPPASFSPPGLGTLGKVLPFCSQSWLG